MTKEQVLDKIARQMEKEFYHLYQHPNADTRALDVEYTQRWHDLEVEYGIA